jgi:hypothetical protein
MAESWHFCLARKTATDFELNPCIQGIKEVNDLFF